MERSFLVSMSRGLFVLALLGGCHRQPKLATLNSQADEVSEAQAREDATLVVEVVSNNFRDASVYLNLGGSRQRLGLAAGHTTSVFKVPWSAHLANTLEASLSAEQIGDDNTVQSSTVQVKPGARLVWTLSVQFYEAGLEVY